MKRASDTSATDDNVNSKKKKKKGNKHVDPVVLMCRRGIQKCCATNNLVNALQLYHDALDDNVQIETQTFSNLLSLCDGLGERHVHVGTPIYNDKFAASNRADKTKKIPSTTKEQTKRDANEKVNGEAKLSKEDAKKKNDEHYDSPTKTDSTKEVQQLSIAERRRYAFEIKQRMDELNIPLGETAYTALIRILIQNKELGEALSFLNQAERAHVKPKLRLYSCLLVAFCDCGDLEKAIELWRRLREATFDATEREYQALMQCAVQAGNVQVMQRVLSELAQDVLVPSKETIRAIVAWFESSHAIENGAACKKEPLLLPPTDAPELIQVQSKHGWTVSQECCIKHGTLQTGCCAGQTLQPITLSADAWKAIYEANETIVLQGMLENDSSQYQGGGKGKKRRMTPKLQEQRRKEWKSFQQYCQNARSRSSCNLVWDVVLDGANIGYYQQNFQSAPKHVDYRQIDWVVRHLQSQNKRVLLVLHQRHLTPPLLPDWAKPIVKRWNSVLYKTPFGCNDDWFWLHAALFSGSGTCVITNDEMRDHYFQMLSPRHFEQFKERHQVRFGFGAWNANNTARQVKLEYPEPYSRRIQCLDNTALVVPLAKKGDEGRFLDGSHVAQDEPKEERYLCIRAKQAP